MLKYSNVHSSCKAAAEKRSYPSKSTDLRLTPKGSTKPLIGFKFPRPFCTTSNSNISPELKTIWLFPLKMSDGMKNYIIVQLLFREASK